MEKDFTNTSDASIIIYAQTPLILDRATAANFYLDNDFMMTLYSKLAPSNGFVGLANVESGLIFYSADEAVKIDALEKLFPIFVSHRLEFLKSIPPPCIDADKFSELFPGFRDRIRVVKDITCADVVYQNQGERYGRFTLVTTPSDIAAVYSILFEIFGFKFLKVDRIEFVEDSGEEIYSKEDSRGTVAGYVASDERRYLITAAHVLRQPNLSHSDRREDLAICDIDMPKLN
jgi:hypothetical protein